MKKNKILILVIGLLFSGLVNASNCSEIPNTQQVACLDVKVFKDRSVLIYDGKDGISFSLQNKQVEVASVTGLGEVLEDFTSYGKKTSYELLSNRYNDAILVIRAKNEMTSVLYFYTIKNDKIEQLIIENKHEKTDFLVTNHGAKVSLDNYSIAVDDQRYKATYEFNAKGIKQISLKNK